MEWNNIVCILIVTPIVSVVFLDLRKAFDTVNHLLLLNELRQIGCSDSALSWFRDYLTGRSQCTNVDNNMSNSEPITCGVPQGSVLGPLLFIIYINNVVKCLKHGSYYMYADDLAIAVSGADMDTVRHNIQSDLDKVSLWCDKFMLTINSDKTHLLWCVPEAELRSHPRFPVLLKGRVLHVVQNFNYLGVVIDSLLSFGAHGGKVNASGKVKLYNLRQHRKYVDMDLSILMYKQMMLPVFDYCDFILESGQCDAFKGLQTIQNHSLRCCMGIWDPRSVGTDFLHSTCLCKRLQVRRNECLLGLMYRRTRVEANLERPRRVLRSNAKLLVKLQRPRGKLYTDSPLYRGTTLWDKLKPAEQKILSHHLFMNKIKSKL